MTYQKNTLILLAAFLMITIFLTACGQEGVTTPNNEHEHSNTSGDSINEPAATDSKPMEESDAAEEAPVGENDAAEEIQADETPSTTSEDTSVDAAPSKPAEPDPEVTSQQHTVEIVEFAFSPSELEIKTGDTVVFINKDAVKHSATADDESFDTGLLSQNKEAEVTFTEAGEFSYYCLPHPAMKGMIIVTNN